MNREIKPGDRYIQQSTKASGVVLPGEPRDVGYLEARGADLVVVRERRWPFKLDDTDHERLDEESGEKVQYSREGHATEAALHLLTGDPDDEGGLVPVENPDWQFVGGA